MSIGLADAQQLLPIATWDVSYFDHALLSLDDLESLALKIRAVLFPGEQPGDNSTDSLVTAKWRNRHCDVMVAWCCIHHGWYHLVTSDKNFHKHRKELAALGLKFVLTPNEAAAAHAT